MFQSPENFMAISCVEFQRSATAVEVVNSPMDEEENLQLKTDFFSQRKLVSDRLLMTGSKLVNCLLLCCKDLIWRRPFFGSPLEAEPPSSLYSKGENPPNALFT